MDKKRALEYWVNRYNYAKDYSDIHWDAEERHEHRDYVDAMELAIKAIEQYTADVQPVDTKEILRHLDSLMLCVGNAYDTSHYLLESDMEFIEKQDKIIKGLLSNKPIKG